MADQQILKPIENPFLHGHEEAENTLLSALSGGRMHHAWLITGPKGIGKATLAYRFARHLLSGAGGGNNGGGLDLLGEPDLGDMSMDSEDPFFHRVATGGHGDIKILSTDQKEGEDAPRTEIPVDEVREINHFLSLTPSESEWRVIVVDSADAMNRNAANALLKHLEEPPAHAIFLMVAHNPGKLLPTIRSRCRTLKLKPLDEENIEKVLEHQLALGSSQDMAFATLLAEGSPGRALELLRLEGRTLYAELLEILQTLPALDVGRVLKLAGSVGGKANEERWQMLVYLLQHFIKSVVEYNIAPDSLELVEGETALKARLASESRLAQWVDLWENVGHMADETKRLHMDRKQTAVTMLNQIQELAA